MKMRFTAFSHPERTAAPTTGRVMIIHLPGGSDYEALDAIAGDDADADWLQQ